MGIVHVILFCFRTLYEKLTPLTREVFMFEVSFLILLYYEKDNNH